ncbi:MAG TPA: DUF4124 domain-containing protein [Pseudomonadales bacterium]|nr:DUF4124 domain-containing protein [Pseudomonadales bacterium]
MTIITTCLLYAGLGLFLIGGVVFVVALFSASLWWGLGGLLFPPVQLIFVFRHWQESKLAIGLQTAGLLLILAAALTGGDAFVAEYEQQVSQYMQKNSPQEWKQVSEMQSLLSAPDSSVVQMGSAVKNAVSTVADNPAINAVTSNVKKSASQLSPSTAPATENKVIYKCVDAKGHVAYTEEPCVGAKSKVITVKENYDSGEKAGSTSIFDSAKKLVDQGKESLK